MSDKTVKTPWKAHLGSIPSHLDYPDCSLAKAVLRAAAKYPDFTALIFMGKKTSYRTFAKNVVQCAKALRTIGVRPGDRVTIAMPNCPQAIYCFYAVNLIGAVSNVIHPLSAESEIEHYINFSKSVTVVTLDQFYGKIEAVRSNCPGLVNVILASIKDELSKPLMAGYMLTAGRKIAKIPSDAPVIRWSEFIKLGDRCFWNYQYPVKSEDLAVILYSGGTTGTTKGIMLSNLNFNALGMQIIASNPMFRPGDRMLSAMPLFHGFGLGICVHSMLLYGAACVLVPRFTPKSYARDLVKYKCNFIAGVPTLFESILRLPSMENVNLSFLKGVYSGGDSLTYELKKRIDTFLYDHHAPIQVREGYGATETVNACCLTPPQMSKAGSVGLPLPDTYIKFVEPGTDVEVPLGQVGEILIAGPTTMIGYLDNPEETAQTLRTHSDGMTWVYTGDLGYMDNEGFVFFRGRSKRMIITSGYNVYPSQIENLLDAHAFVHMSCVIGVPDELKMHAVKAFIVLKPDIAPTEETKRVLLEYCRKNIAKYAMPREIEFRNELPRTAVGKIAFKELEEEEEEKYRLYKASTFLLDSTHSNHR